MTPQGKLNTIFLGRERMSIAFRAHKTNSESQYTNDDQDMFLSLGGAASNSAQAYENAGGTSFITGLISVAAATEDLVEVFSNNSELPERQRTATTKQISDTVLNEASRSATTASTSRLGSADAATFANIELWLRRSKRLVFAELTAKQAPLLLQFMTSNHQESCLLLSRAQCEDRETTLVLAKECSILQLTARNLELLTGIQGDVASGVNFLRDAGVGQVIVIDGKRGITAFLDSEWHHQPAFRSHRPGGGITSGDIVFGTFLAARDQGRTNQESLRCAAAAAEMQAAKIDQQVRGLGELFEFAAVTPFQSYVANSQLPPRTSIIAISKAVQIRFHRMISIAKGATGLIQILVQLLTMDIP